jgi:iron(III) transport system substrate-binding protein
MPSPSGLNEKYLADFEEKTGVDVELFEGTTGGILARVETEKDNPVADVVVLASWFDGLSVKNSGELMSYTPENADKPYAGRMRTIHCLAQALPPSV